MKSIIHALNTFLIENMGISSEIIDQIVYDYNVDPKRKSFGDLSSNAPLILSRFKKQSPMKLADEIAKNFTHPLCISCSAVAPGFLNIVIDESLYLSFLREVIDSEKSLLTGKTENSLNYNVEFVSANPTGPLHIGHGRGGVIGDVLVRVLRARGHQATAEFYINDAGSQIEKLGSSLYIRCQQLCGQAVDLPEGSYHGEYLLKMARELIDREGCEVLEKSILYFSDHAREILLKKIHDTLAAYAISFDVWFSEKKLHEMHAIEKAVDKAKKNGFIYEQDGALWLASTRSGDDKDRVIRKANGEWTYVASDIAYLENKNERHFDKYIMILGQDHHSYVIRLKAVLQALGQNPDKLDVILYQLVTLKEGEEVVRLSKRAGKIISLEDIIAEVGSDVARFFYLHRKADAHLDFDLSLALQSTENNPVYYIQYAYVRLASILKKAELGNLDTMPHGEKSNYHYNDLERMLLRKIMSLNHLCETIERTYQTHLLAYYVHDVASLFHTLYGKNKFIDQENKDATYMRILLAKATKRTLEVCCDMLGINRPEKM